MSRGKKVGSDNKNKTKKQTKTKNQRQRKKVNDSQIKIPKGHKNQTRTTNVFFLIRDIYSIVCRKSYMLNGPLSLTRALGKEGFGSV